MRIGGTRNHIHLLLRLKPKHFIPDLIKRIKGSSSKWINTRFDTNERFAWQVGYGIFSVSVSQLSKVKSYIANQKEHHKQISFEEEFTKLLKKHLIDYNPKYLWK